MGRAMAADTATRRRILIVDDDRALRHALAVLLTDAGHSVDQAADGPDALRRLDTSAPDIVLLDVGLPSMSGLDVLAHARAASPPPIVVMMTADDTPETLLEAVRRQAYRYLRKPFPPSAIVGVIDDAIAQASAAALSIEVVSARPEWVELVAPCVLEMADRVQSFVMQLDADLPKPIRESVAQAFHELLTNAIEWGGKLDPERKVRISCVRAKRLLIYRIADPGEGFNIDRLRHAAINNPEDDPLHHAGIREDQGLRPGGLGLMLTRALVDELIYNEARNEVLFIKYVD
jgi:CheY-like chemotaxis protein